MREKKRLWPAEKREMERMYYFLLERPTKIIDIPSSSDDIGYTSSDGNIHLAYFHPIMKDMTEDKHPVFRLFGQLLRTLIPRRSYTR